MANIYEKIPGCILGQFSKLKFVNGSNFKKFKDYFLANYISGFIVPAETFDNVKGKFPIGFTIWNTSEKSKIDIIATDVFDKNGNFKGIKIFHGDLPNNINRWIKLFDDKTQKGIAFMGNPSPDFQHNSQLYLSLNKGIEHFNFYNFTQNKLRQGCIYFSIRNCIEATWLNDRDQFLYPNDHWQTDEEFQNDCFAYSLFNGQNRISCNEEINHWIPFTEQEVNAKEKFASNFMTNFINGKLTVEQSKDLFAETTQLGFKTLTGLEFSIEAKAVFDAGRELWSYYHSQNFPSDRGVPEGRGVYNVNASLYDIREYFQGRNDKGRMNSRSTDEKYTTLISELRKTLNILADQIKPKIYEYEFLKE